MNDNEQALITAARRIAKGLECCVRYVHHVGKANARAATLDQYSARGGSSLPDGSRMTAILQPVNHESELIKAAPYGWKLGANQFGAVMARAKLSYEPPLPEIWLKRDGYRYEFQIAERLDNDQKRRALADQLLRFIASELEHDPPRRHSTSTRIVQ